MLLTRIEVFEQAVHMMHHQLDRIKQKEGKTGPDSLSMRQVEKKSRLIKEQLLKARLGYSVNKDLLATLRTTNQKNWCNKLFDSDLKGWGTGPRVPVFMRFHGYIRNTQMDEADALLRVKEVWSFKTLHDNQLKDEGRGGQTSSLSSFFIQYLDRRYRSSDRDRVEFVYNFVACMCRFFTRSSFAIFAKILFGDLHERHFYDMVVLVSNLKDMLSRWDVASSENVREHVIKKTVFVANLQRFFPRKTARDFEELILIAERDARIPSFEEFGECYDVLRLLMDDKGGDDTNFLECVKSQYMEEVEAFLTDIRTQLWQKAGWRDPPLRQHKFAKMQQRTPEDMNLSSAQKKMMTEAKARARKRFGGDGGGSSREGGDALHPQPHAHSSDGDEDTRSMDQVSLSCAEIETVLFSVDPGKTRAEVREYLVRGTQDVYVSASTRASIEVFCENLLSGLLTRSHHWVRLQGQMTVGTV